MSNNDWVDRLTDIANQLNAMIVLSDYKCLGCLEVKPLSIPVAIKHSFNSEFPYLQEHDAVITIVCNDCKMTGQKLLLSNMLKEIQECNNKQNN